MDNTSTAVTPNWRAEERVEISPSRTPLLSRGVTRYLVMITMLTVLGLLGGVLSWYRPLPSPNVLPVFITEYQSEAIPFTPMGAADELGLFYGDYFPKLDVSVGASQERHTIVSELDGLAELDSTRPVVVYVNAFALRGEKGEVFILPGDTTLRNSFTWLSLDAVLQKLASCPSRNKLLVLNIMAPLANPMIGLLENDVASGIVDALDRVPDRDRLVLCACSPGQTTFVSPEMDRSVFEFYFEEALRGYADGYHDGLYDGLITAKEAAAFVRARVNRWTKLNRGVEQLPVLFGGGADFAIVALKHGRRRPHLPIDTKWDYPDWLATRWKIRDGWWKQGQFRVLPRMFQREQALLLAAEASWRQGVPAEQVKISYLRSFDRLQSDFDRHIKAFQPVAVSLAQEIAYGAKPDQSVNKAVADLITELQKQTVGAKPSDVPKIRTKILDSFRTKVKKASRFALAEAVFSQAVAADIDDPETLRLLDSLLLRPTDRQPHYAETLVLRQLADLSDRIDSADWPFTSARMMLRLTEQVEQLSGHLHAFPWVEPILPAAAQVFHNGCIGVLTNGYSDPEDAATKLELAGRIFNGLSNATDSINQGRLVLDKGLALLPFYSPYLDSATDLQRTWVEAGDAARDLGDLLRNPPDFAGFSPEQAASPLDEAISNIRNKTAALEVFLDGLNRPFEQANVARLIKLSQQGQAKGELYREMEALLRVPNPAMQAGDRIKLWNALRALGLRLHKATIAIDHAEDDARIRTPRPVAFDQQEAMQKKQERALGRASFSLRLLELGGVTAEQIDDLQQLMESLHAGKARFAEVAKLGQDLAKLWRSLSVLQAKQQARLEQRLLYLLPPLDRYPNIDDTPTPPALKMRIKRAEQQWTWLSQHYRYLARDYRGLGLNVAGVQIARQFFSQASQANLDLADPPPITHPDLQLEEPTPTLSAKHPTGIATLNVKLVRPAKLKKPRSMPVEVQAMPLQDGWIDVRPMKTMLQKSGDVQLKLTMRKASARQSKSPPKGFLVAAVVDRRMYHRVVPVSFPLATDRVAAILSSNKKSPVPAITEIQLRPGFLKQKYYLFLKNSSKQAKQVRLEVLSNGIPFREPIVVKLAPQATQKVSLAPPKKKEAAVKPTAKQKTTNKLPPFIGPLGLQVYDAQTNRLLDAKTIPIHIASPREYVRVSSIEFDPPNERNKFKNRLSVQLRAAPIGGPPIPVALVLPPKQIPGLVTVGGATFKGKLKTTNNAKPVTLFADKVVMNPDADENGLVFINVDGVARTFIFQTTFARSGTPTTPVADGRPAVRLTVPKFVKAKSGYSFNVQVDNAPLGASLEVGLGKNNEDGRFQPDLRRTFPSAKDRTLGFKAEADGSLVFAGTIQDWTVDFDTTRILGSRLIRARLLNIDGKLIREAEESLLIDRNAPSDVAIVDIPKNVQKGSTIDARVICTDKESGIASVKFWVGTPKDGKIPKLAEAVDAAPADKSQNLWAAKLTLPDKTETVPISVEVKNKVGLTRFDTIKVNLVVKKPGPGKITGKVTSGGLPQPDLKVYLLEEKKNKVLTTTTTKTDGSFEFADVKPGKYRIYCFKAASRRKDLVDVTVESEKTAEAPLSLQF